MLSYLCRSPKYLLSCLQDGVWNTLDHEARYGPTKCPPLPYEGLVTNSQQTKACEGLWSEGEAAGQREGSALQGKAVGSSTRQKQHSESRAAAVLEPGWAQADCRSNQCFAWTQQPHSSRPPQTLFPPGLWGTKVWEDPQHLLWSALLCCYARGCWH